MPSPAEAAHTIEGTIDARSTPPPDTGTLIAATRVANALGVAYATYQLFQNPQGQEAFAGAVGDLTGATAIGALEVNSDSFRWARNPVPAQHPGVGRLSARLFIHGVAAVRFVSAPSPRDIVGMFDVIRRNTDDDELVNGPGRALERQGISTIRLFNRAMLTEADAEREDDGDPSKILGAAGTLDLDGYLGDPEFLAETLLRAADHDPDALATLVAERYIEAIGSIEPEDVWGREEVVHTFVDTFFYFSRNLQARLLAELLARRAAPEFQWFLDQFASHELQDLAPLLDENSHPLLMEYATIAKETGEIRLDELHTLLTETAPDRSAGIPVESLIEQVLQAQGHGTPPALQALHCLKAQCPDGSSSPKTSADVMRGLLGLVETKDDLKRRFRLWARKLSAALESHDLALVTTWMDALFADMDPEVDADTFMQALSESMSPLAVAHLADALRSTAGVVRTSVARVLPYLTEPIIERLGDEPDRGRRRILIDMLAVAARADPWPVVRALDDPRWYLVRNLVLVLSRSQHPEIADEVRPLTRHLDPRVRREALRALHALAGAGDLAPFVEALTDDDGSVRSAAAAVTRSAFDPAILSSLQRMLDAGLSLQVKLEVIGLLGSVSSSEARAMLKDIASKRTWASSSTSRSIRKAAQQALQEPQ